MKNYILMLALAFSMAACDSNVKPKGSDGMDGADNGGMGIEDANGGARVGAIGDSYGNAGTALPVSYDRNAIHDDSSVLAERTVYFEFDSSEVASNYLELIKHHGKYLALNADASIRLEGHTDERGSREYNVALADRRAQAVKQLLMFQGASSNQMTIISYGEEKPEAFGHDESAWYLNRRAQLIYQ